MGKLNLNTAESTRVKLTQDQQKKIQKMYEDIAKKIAKEAEKLPNTTSGTLRKQYLEKLGKQINDQLASLQKEVEQSIESSMSQVAEKVVEDNLSWLKSIGMPISGGFSHVPAEVVQSVITGQVYSGKWSLSKAIWDTTKKTQDDVNKIVAEGIAQNKSAYDIAKDLEKYVDPLAKKPWDWSKVYPGTNKKVDYNAQRLARTLVSHAYQQAFVKTTQKNPFVTKYKWLGSNSHRICPICEARNGKLFEKDELPLDHPNGMCTFVAVIDDSMEDIADRLANWAKGGSDPALDEYAKDLFSPKGISQQKLVETKIDSLPQFQNSKYKQNVIPLANREVGLMVADDLRYTREENDLGIQLVSVDMLETLQKRISSENLKSMLKSGMSLDDLGDEPVQVVLYDGHYVLIDGNHRSSLAKILGIDKIKAHIFRLPPEGE